MCVCVWGGVMLGGCGYTVLCVVCSYVCFLGLVCVMWSGLIHICVLMCLLGSVCYLWPYVFWCVVVFMCDVDWVDMCPCRSLSVLCIMCLLITGLFKHVGGRPLCVSLCLGCCVSCILPCVAGQDYNVSLPLCVLGSVCHVSFHNF